VFAAVFDGPIYHWDGKSWRQVHRARGTIRSFSGSGASDVFAVGDKGALEHFDGTVWRSLRDPDGGRVDESFTGDVMQSTAACTSAAAAGACCMAARLG
jgi:hypothetical protein